MRILFVGDVVGKPGRHLVRDCVPKLRVRLGLDLVVVNAENSAGGSGIDGRCYRQLIEAGVDVITMGDHIYRNKEIFPLFDRSPPIVKPANFPPGSPGRDHAIVETAGGEKVAVVSLLGRLFMKPVDCPFLALDRVLESLGDDVPTVVVDLHAEATSDKRAMLWYAMGRVSAVFGTHTHVPTADADVFPPGTAYITDVGMTGPYESVIGRRYDRVVHTTVTFEPRYFDVATGDPRLSGAVLDVDGRTGRAESVRLLHVRPEEIDQLPSEPEP